MSGNDLAKGLFESAAGEWVLILSLIFGGCCSNVWALESMLKEHPKAGTFLTFAQFVYVAVQNLSSQLEYPSKGEKGSGISLPRLKRRRVPLRRWAIQVILFLGISLMNNYALGMKIPMTIHIIFRSGGLCVSMITGYLVARKRYSFGQIVAAIMITTGITIATMYAPRPPKSGVGAAVQSAETQGVDTEAGQFSMGIALLALALVFSALLGLWQEETYRKYGKQWREGLFYSHFLSLPFFFPMRSSIRSTFISFAMSTPMTLVNLSLPEQALISTESFSSGKMGEYLSRGIDVVIPSAFFALAVNVITQGLCIKGVNRLTARVSSTTVNLVLTIRKAVSLAISVWYYGSGMTPGLAVGAALVLVGTILYSMSPLKTQPPKKKDDPDPTLGSSSSTQTIKSGAEFSKGTANGDLRHRGQ